MSLDTFKRIEIQHLHPSWPQSLSSLGASGDSPVGTRLHSRVTSSNVLLLYGPELTMSQSVRAAEDGERCGRGTLNTTRPLVVTVGRQERPISQDSSPGFWLGPAGLPTCYRGESEAPNRRQKRRQVPRNGSRFYGEP